MCMQRGVEAPSCGCCTYIAAPVSRSLAISNKNVSWKRCCFRNSSLPPSQTACHQLVLLLPLAVLLLPWGLGRNSRSMSSSSSSSLYYFYVLPLILFSLFLYHYCVLPPPILPSPPLLPPLQDGHDDCRVPPTALGLLLVAQLGPLPLGVFLPQKRPSPPAAEASSLLLLLPVLPYPPQHALHEPLLPPSLLPSSHLLSDY